MFPSNHPRPTETPAGQRAAPNAHPGPPQTPSTNPRPAEAPAGDPGPPEMSAAERLQWLVSRARGGDASVVPELRAALDANPWAQAYGNLERIVEESWIQLAAGDDLHLRECLVRQVADLKRELGGPTPTAIERLLAARAAATHLQVAYYDARQAQARGLTPAQARQLQRDQEGAQRRYLQVLRTLTTVRKYLTPARPATKAGALALPDIPRFSGVQPGADSPVHGIGVLN